METETVTLLKVDTQAKNVKRDAGFAGLSGSSSSSKKQRVITTRAVKNLEKPLPSKTIITSNTSSRITRRDGTANAEEEKKMDDEQFLRNSPKEEKESPRTLQESFVEPPPPLADVPMVTPIKNTKISESESIEETSALMNSSFVCVGTDEPVSTDDGLADVNNAKKVKSRSSSSPQSSSLWFFAVMVILLSLVQWDYYTTVQPQRRARLDHKLCRNIVAQYEKGPNGLGRGDRQIFFKRSLIEILEESNEQQKEWLDNVQMARTKAEEAAAKGSTLSNLMDGMSRFFNFGWKA